MEVLMRRNLFFGLIIISLLVVFSVGAVKAQEEWWGSISGQIYRPDGTPYGTTVCAYLVGDIGYLSPASCTTASYIDGSYSITLYSGGNYWVGLYDPYFAGGYIYYQSENIWISEVINATQVFVSPGQDIVNINYYPSGNPEGAGIFGTVFDPEGLPLENSLVCYGSGPYEASNEKCTFTDINGNYHLLPNEEWNYTISAHYEGLVSKYIWDSVYYKPFMVVTDINFQLDYGSMITGSILDAEDNSPILQSWICLFDFDTNAFINCYSQYPSSSYTTDLIPLGRYKIQANGMLDYMQQGYMTEYYQDKWWFEAPDPFIIDQVNQTYTLDFHLGRSGNISGTVLENNNPANNYQICFLGVEGTTYDLGCKNWINPDGTFSVYIPVGKYIVYLKDPVSGNVLQYYHSVLNQTEASVVDLQWQQSVTNINFTLPLLIETVEGENVEIQADTQTIVSFSTVTTGGETWVEPATETPPNFTTLLSSFNLQTTASFDTAQVCLNYDDSGLDPLEESLMQLLHFENEIWVNVTDPGYPDIEENRICGTVTSFSPFALIIPEIPLAINEIFAPLEPLPVNTLVYVSASIQGLKPDKNYVGTWSWGDGTTSEGFIDFENRSIIGDHNYTLPGIYTLTLNITDDQGFVTMKEFQYIVIYEQSGGFVTGGGWIANQDNKINFGLNARYPKNSSIPDGQMEIGNPDSDWKFKSSSYQWFAIFDNLSMLRGTGTLNGLDGYGFVFSGLDSNTDKIRIKIWELETGSVVFDSQPGSSNYALPTTPLGGGSVVIH